MSGAVSNINMQKENISNEKEYVSLANEHYISTALATEKMANSANKYFDLDKEAYKPERQSIQGDAYVPWTNLYTGDILEWYIRILYKGNEFVQQVPITVSDFQETFLKHPSYGRELKFNVDSDPEDDLYMIIGFYWSIIAYPNGVEYRSLESRLRVRQLDTGGYLDDQYGGLEVWSELNVNLGLIKGNARSRNEKTDSILNLNEKIINNKFYLFIAQLIEICDLPVLKKFLNNLIEVNDNTKSSQRLDASDDYFSIGTGYRCPQGQLIPKFVEKRFSFAKGVKWRDGSIFDPVIFQQQISPGTDIIGTGIIDILYGFRAHEASSGQDRFDIAFNVEFEPAVNLKTKFIPSSGYVAYFLNIPSGDNWGGWTPRSQPTRISYTADINKGGGVNVPTLSLVLDKIDENLAGSSQKWFSFDITGINGFEYTASHRFNVGITVDVPGLFSEKVEVKGLPKNIKVKWGIDDLDFIINPNRFMAALDLFSDLEMSSDIEKVTVFYPKFEGYEDAPDSPLLEIRNVPSSQRASVGGSLDLRKSSNILTVAASGGTSFTSSSSINGLTLYYPKADWENDPDIVFIDAPAGMPGSAFASISASLRVNLDDLMDLNNHIYGNIQHGFDSNLDEVDVFLPGNQDVPLVSFIDIPSYATSGGELYWAQLKGYGYAYRSSQNLDPIEINLEYGDYNLFNRLEIRDGHITTSFKVAADGYFNLDTSKHMFKNDLRFYNNANDDTLLLTVEDVSAEDLETSWDIDNSGSQLKINDLAFSGVVDTLNDLNVYIKFSGKSTTLALDWEVGEKGNFEIEIAQDEEATIDFSDLLPGGGDFLIDGYITLDNDIGFDMQWKLDLGDNAQNPGYIKINKNNAGDNIKYFDLYFTYQDKYGLDLYMKNPTYYMDLQWYFDVDDIWPPYIFVWFEYFLGADIFDGQLLWTDTEDTGDTYWIDLEDYLP
jgi:hypothetical protein